MTITKEQILAIMPNAKGVVDTYLSYINKYAPMFHIDNRLRMCYYLATIAIESGELRYVTENLNYSAQGLLKTFPRYFNSSNVNLYARNPQKIANRCYANRMGNGDEASGDGWKYRGRGFIQLTGKSNYKAYNDYLVKGGMAVDLLKNPDLIAQPLGTVKSSMWFFDTHGCNELADKDMSEAIRKRINGGTNGMSQFKLYYQRAKFSIK